MMLPIFFHKRNSYKGYKPARRVSSYGTRRQWGNGGCMLPVILLVCVIAALWCLWYFYPLSEKERRQCDTSLVTETRYIIADDTTALFTFTATQGDSLLRGIHHVSDTSIHSWSVDTIAAQWTRRWDILPYNGGSLIASAPDTTAICKLSHKEITVLLQRQAQAIKQGQDVVAMQKTDVDYFLRTHTVLDNGFDIVARYGKRLDAYAKVLASSANTIQKALHAKSLSIRMERRYYLFADSTGHRIECIPHESNGKNIRLTTAESSAHPSFFARLYRHNEAAAALSSRHIHHAKQLYCSFDSIGDYKGQRDAQAIPNGYGSFQNHNGAYYEGEWQHGKRNGVGFSIIPGKKLRLGEWKNDRFLGERIAYTPERIYGIDISRHQHEKGRKKYSIDWKNLRIVSLGKMSKKVIHGKVDYPVRFVYIKATEGVTVRNKYFAADYVAGKKYGYRMGAYHFFSIKTSGYKQAINFLRNSRYSKGDLPPVLDLEPTDAQIKKAGGIHALFRNVRQWLNTVEARRGKRPILYVSQRFVNKYLPLAKDLHNDYDVWIARYGEYKPDVNLVYWQLSPDGRVRGIHGDVDINVYNGFDF